MAAAEVLGDGSPDGVSLGRTTTEKVSLYGVDPVVQAAAIAVVDADASDYDDMTAATDAGCVSLAAFATKFNTLLSDLKDLGVIA